MASRLAHRDFGALAAVVLHDCRNLSAARTVVTITGSRPRPRRPNRSRHGKADVPDAERFFQSIVKIQARAVPNARSSATLGQEREGTGIVIGEDGLILTIGYLIVEADEVNLVDQRGRDAAGAGRRLRSRDGTGARARHSADGRAADAVRRIRQSSPSAIP